MSLLRPRDRATVLALMLLLNAIREAIGRTFGQDLASGALTTEATAPEDVMAVAHAVAKKPLVVCDADVVCPGVGGR